MENIETLLAAVAQTQGFDDDEPVGSPPRLVNSGSSPEIVGDVGGSQLAVAPLKVPGNTQPHVVVNPPPETSVSEVAQLINPVEKRRRGRPRKGQLPAKPPPPKRKKEQEEEGKLSANAPPPKRNKEQEEEGKLLANPPPPKRNKEQEEEGKLSAKPPAPKRKKVQEEEDEEDVCFICFDGGSLVLCDRKGCPKAYHPSCIKRDEAFFKSKAKWNCGWHICSVCRKPSYYICYTCPYSLCKGCTKDAEYFRVRGNKGFCNTCMKIIMLIENKDQTSNGSAVQVDFDDITSWEYLFKMYWVTLKEKLSLTLNDLTRAKSPWKSVAPVACKPQLSTAVDRKVYFPSSSGCLDIKLQEVHNDGLTKAQSNNAEGVPIIDKHNKNTNEESITAEPGSNKQVAEKDVDNVSIKDAADPRSTDKPCDEPIEMPKLLESHEPVKKDSQNNSLITDRFVGSLEGDMEVDGNNSDQIMGTKSRNQETCENHKERATQNTSNKYAAIDVHNMNLIYLQRNLMENLIEDKENLLAKVVGSIVRIRISSDDQKPDVYRLVQVVGISKVAKPYKIGDRTADMTLEVLNLGKKEVVSVDAISNQEFTEAECRQLDQYIKCGLLKQYTLDEVKKKAVALQSVRFNIWLDAEVLRLYHLLDQASKKGCEEEVSEYVRKIQLLKSPEERQRRISEIPEIHADVETGPHYESEDAISGGNSIKDGHASPRCSRSPLSGKGPLSPKEKGTEEGPIHTQSKTVENIDACGLQGLEKPPNQVDITISAVSGGDDQAVVRSGLETSTATGSIVNSLPEDNIEIEKLWHYRDWNGKIQGPFSMMHLRLSCTTSQFPPDMRIWTNHEQYDSLLLTDALNGKLHGASDLPHKFSSESREYKAINGSNGDSKQTDVAQSTSASVLADNNGESKRAHESPLPKCWDLFKDKTTSAQDAPAYSSISSSSLGQISMTTNLVRKCDEFNHVAEFTGKNSSVSTQNETTYQSLASPEEKLIPLPIGLSLNDTAPEPVAEPLSKSRNSVKQEVEIDVFNLPSPKHWGFPTAEKQQSESSNVPIQNSGFLELLSLKPRSDNEENEIRADENKQSGLVNLSVPYSGPSWSSHFNMSVGGMQFPETASDWFGYSTAPAKQSEPIRPEVNSEHIVTSDNNQFAHVSSSHPAPNTASWLAMINEPIEFDAFGEESVSDLLAEVDAMESQGTLPSPTSAMKFAKELIQDCKDDCFSSIEDFSPTPDPGKSDDLSSTGEIQLSCQSSAPCKPVSLIDALSGMHSSGSSTGETSAPVYSVEPGLDFHRGPPNMGQDIVGTNMAPGMGPETSEPGWGSVQGNINLVTVQGNVNLVLGGPAQGMANLGWGSNQGTTWGNPNINHNPMNGSLPWDSQRKHSGERFTNGREWGYQGVETGFGRGRLPWGRPPYGGGGGYSRPLPKGQRVCKFYESGRCRKGAFCDYLHP